MPTFYSPGQARFGGPLPGQPATGGFSSTQPVRPPIDVPGGFQMPGWLSTGLGFLGKFLPHDADGSIAWGKLAGIGAAGAAGISTMQNNQANQDYLNKLLAMKEDDRKRQREDYDSRAPIRKAAGDTIQQHVGNIGKNIFTPYLGGR